MNKNILLLLAIVLSLTIKAAPNYVPVGTNIAYGDASNSNTIFNTITNPSYNAIIDVENKINYGFGFAVQAQLEVTGLEGVSDFLSKKIENNSTNVQESDASSAQSQLESDLNEFITKYDGGGLSLILGANIPLIIRNKSLKGGVTLDYTKQIASKISIVKGENSIDVGYDETNESLTVNEGAGGIDFIYRTLTEIAIGYGKDVFKKDKKAIDVGVTFRMLSLLSNQQILDFQGAVGNSDNDNSESDSFKLSDAIKKGSEDTQIVLDIGINLREANYAVSLLLANLNEPVFKNNNLTNESYTYFYGKVDDNFKLKQQIRLSGKYFSEDRYWTLAGSYDLLTSNDILNNDIQWLTLSGSYAIDVWYIPDFRLGIRKNLVGSAFSYKSIGFTFGFFDLDVSTTTTNLDIANQKDTGLIVGLSLEFSF